MTINWNIRKNITEEEILLYAVKKLSKTDLIRISKLMENDSELSEHISILESLVAEQPQRKPPENLEKKVLSSLGIKPKNFIEIILEKTGRLLEVIKGNNYFQPELSLIPVPVRNRDESFKVFSTTFSNHPIYVEISTSDTTYLRLKTDNNNKKYQFRFKISTRDKNVLDILADETGSTKPIPIDRGCYNIAIEKNYIPLGNIQVTIK